MNLGPVVRPGRARAHASNLFIPTTRLWAALKSRLLLGQAGLGSRNLPEISPKHRITDLYAWTLVPPGSDPALAHGDARPESISCTGRLRNRNLGCRGHVKMSGLRSTSNVRSGVDALWAGWVSRARPRRP